MTPERPIDPLIDSLTVDDGERYYQSALQWIRFVATAHYIGDAFDPEHMRELANLATGALRGDPVTDYDAATERAQHEARRLMEWFSEEDADV